MQRPTRQRIPHNPDTPKQRYWCPELWRGPVRRSHHLDIILAEPLPRQAPPDPYIGWSSNTTSCLCQWPGHWPSVCVIQQPMEQQWWTPTAFGCAGGYALHCLKPLKVNLALESGFSQSIAINPSPAMVSRSNTPCWEVPSSGSSNPNSQRTGRSSTLGHVTTYKPSTSILMSQMIPGPDAPDPPR